MAYTTIDDPTIYFNTKLYTGNASTQSITGVGFQPDWVWIKRRNDSSNHILTDVVRGNTKWLESNGTNAEQTGTDRITSFDSDGFGLGSNANVNANSGTFVSWNWKAGTSFTNDASATSVGTIDSTGSTNQTAGFSIVSWTGTGSAGTVAHNLGSIPEWYIIKVRSGETNNWAVYHNKSNANPEQYALYLDGSSGATDDSGLANDTAPTSTVFSLTGSNYGNKNTYTYIGYFFSEVKGYSKFGKYEGNGNTNGTFVYTGFRPAWLMVKRTSGDNWTIMDNKRNTFNRTGLRLFANETLAEGGTDTCDFLSNGFKLRRNDAGENGDGQTYIYMAFAEAPFTNSSGVPCNAR